MIRQNIDQIWKHSIKELSVLLEKKKCTVLDIVSSCINRIEHTNERINGIVYLDIEKSISAAHLADQRRLEGKRLSPLDGIPFLVKDSIFVRDMPTTNGSNIFGDFIPDKDEIGVERLRSAGMIPLGKTNTPEFAAQGYTGNARFGITRNPWNLALTPGGSSGGSVAAVAAGMAPAALGTDGGGSIRRPAGYVGIVALKSSAGRIPRYHRFSPISLDFEVIAPVTRTIADLFLLYKYMAGPDVRDRSSILFTLPKLKRWKRPISSNRVLFVSKVENGPVDKAITAGVEIAADRLRAMGYIVEERRAPFRQELLDRIWPPILDTGIAHLVQPHLDRLDEVGEPLRLMAERGFEVKATDYLEAMNLVDSLRAETGKLFQSVDFILSPSAAAMPWEASEVYPKLIDGQPAGPRDHAPFTRFVNAVGYPAIVLPTQPAPDGMPIGFQLIGRYGADDELFSIASEYERRWPFADRWPELE